MLLLLVMGAVQRPLLLLLVVVRAAQASQVSLAVEWRADLQRGRRRRHHVAQ